jgi:hypothetical protein
VLRETPQLTDKLDKIKRRAARFVKFILEIYATEHLKKLFEIAITVLIKF